MKSFRWNLLDGICSKRTLRIRDVKLEHSQSILPGVNVDADVAF